MYEFIRMWTLPNRLSRPHSCAAPLQNAVGGENAVPFSLHRKVPSSAITQKIPFSGRRPSVKAGMGKKACVGKGLKKEKSKE